MAEEFQWNGFLGTIVLRGRPFENCEAQMQRIAFRLRVKPEKLDEYVRIHAEVWPELLADLRAAGYRNYSIFSDGPELFAYFECDDLDAAQAAMAKSDANHRWQAWMTEYLDTPVDPEGKESLHLLPMVFHTD